MNKECLWGVVPRDDISRMMIIAEFGEFCNDDQIETNPIETDDGIVKVLIVEEIFIHHLITMMNVAVPSFDTYIKKGESEWKKVEEDLYE